MSSNANGLLQLIADSTLTGYLAGMPSFLDRYDHLICFSQEVELMWKSRSGLTKILYLWNRYFSLIALRYGSARSSFDELNLIIREIKGDRVQCIISTVIVGTVDFVLMLRVWILYGRPRVFAWLFSCIAAGAMKSSSLVKGCYAYNVPRFLTLTAAAPVFVTFVMFIMTVYKCTTTLKRATHHVMPVWRLFLRDGVLWFLAVFVAAGAELSLWAMRRETLKEVLVV
ncbi:hypothetical protein B0H19DRAFT_1087861, partial [Mycena capillaripes]